VGRLGCGEIQIPNRTTFGVIIDRCDPLHTILMVVIEESTIKIQKYTPLISAHLSSSQDVDSE
jgi:hypothetical protein